MFEFFVGDFDGANIVSVKEKRQRKKCDDGLMKGGGGCFSRVP